MMRTKKSQTTHMNHQVSKHNRNVKKEEVFRKSISFHQHGAVSKEDKEILLDRLRVELLPLVKSHKLKGNVVFGTNSVIKLLEKRLLDAVIVARDNKTASLCRHISEMSKIQGVPVCVLRANSSIIGEIFNKKHLMAIGIKKIKNDDVDKIDTTADSIELKKLSSLKDFIVEKSFGENMSTFIIER